ncbi:hypothetical protein M1446_04520 [Candidatus Dependentiae bacterium]|nr:hypothetical protein [Candidatus Dependentiae bacterium]
MKKILLILPIFLAINAREKDIDPYVAINRIHPGQIRYSQANVDQKINTAIKKGYATRECKTNLQSKECILKFDNGRSIMSSSPELPVIKVPAALDNVFGNKNFILIDGHHDVKASLTLGAKTVPIKVKEDLGGSTMSEQEFWNYLESKGYTYPFNLEGGQRANIPSDFNVLQDDTNRYFAAITARKYEGWDTKPEESTYTSPVFKPEYPLWVKVGKDIPFIEFMISDKLNDHNKRHADKFIFSSEMENNPTKMQQLIEKARIILKENPIKGLKLIPEKTFYKDINLNEFRK